MKKNIHCAVLFILALEAAYAQDTSSANHWASAIPRSWLRVGIGGTNSHWLIGGGLFFRVGHAFSVGGRGGVAFERVLLTQPTENFWEITPSISYTPAHGSTGMISTILGIGLIGGTKRGSFLRREVFVMEVYEKVQFRTLGVAAELQAALFIPGAKGIALTADIIVNQNNERSYVGYHIGIQFTQP